jgi:hypothetical protein
VGKLSGCSFGCLAVLIAIGFWVAIHGRHGRDGGLAGIAFPGNLLPLLAQLLIERAKRVVEAFIEGRATFVGCLRAVGWYG